MRNEQDRRPNRSLRPRLAAWWPALAAVVAVLVAAFLVLRPSSSSAGLVGKRAPDFTLLDVGGRSVRLTGFSGHPVVLNFWGVNCLPCRRELPVLQQAYSLYRGQGLVILGVDEQLDDAQAVQLFTAEHGASYPMILDPGSKLMAPYGLDALPRSFLIDREGVIRADEQAPFLDLGPLKAALRPILVGSR